MDASKIPDFLAEQQQQGTPETQSYFLTFEDFWERKLWHQLTDALVEFFRLPESAPQRLAIFKTFVLSFADRINQLKFVALGLMAATECAGKLFNNTLDGDHSLMTCPLTQTTKNDWPSSHPWQTESTKLRQKTHTSMRWRTWPTSSCD